jgi:hypothetical protein
MAGVAMAAGHRPCSLEGGRGLQERLSRRIRLRAAQVAMSRGLPRTHAVSTPVDRHAGDDRILSGASDRRGHRRGHRHQPGQVYRTPAVRRAVARAAVPEAADGQSVHGSIRLVTTSSTFPQGRPCERPPAAAVLGRQHRGMPEPNATPGGGWRKSHGRDSRVAGGGRSLPQRAPGSSRFETGLSLLFRTGMTTPPGRAGTSHPRTRMPRRWSRPCA